MDLLEAQFFFSEKLCELLSWLRSEGYKVSMGECYRPLQMAKWYQEHNQGILNSNHTRRLAVDLNIFKDRALVATKEELLPIAIFWKSLTSVEFSCYWGGDFESPDNDHFSVGWQGIK